MALLKLNNITLDIPWSLETKTSYICNTEPTVFLWLSGSIALAAQKVVGSIPREHTLIKKCISWMHCKSLWIKASAKCINVNVNVSLDHKAQVYLQQ